MKKLVGTQCQGEVDNQCPNFVNKSMLPAHKRFCECGSPVKELTATNWTTVLSLIVAVVVVLGGSASYVYYRIERTVNQTAAKVASTAASITKDVTGSANQTVTTPQKSVPAPEPQAGEVQRKVDDALATVAFKNGIIYASTAHFDNAVKEFETVEKANPEFPKLQMNLGAAYLQLRQFDQARLHLEKAQEQEPNEPNTLYNLACLSAVSGNQVQAISFLKQAVANGFTNRSAIQNDTDLKGLHSKPEFREIVNRIALK